MEKLGVSQDQLMIELKQRYAELKSYENRLVKVGSETSPQLASVQKEMKAIQDRIDESQQK